MNSDPTFEHSSGDSLEPGIALVLRAQESGEWKPVVDWLADHANHAASLARFLSGDRNIAQAFSPSAFSIHPGSVVGVYELREQIGEGGMGVVFRAHDLVLKRDVALKLVRTADGFSADRLARFRFEAETVANLDHPNVVRVLTSGEVGGMPYLAMPLMEGGSLAKRMAASGAVKPKEAAAVLRDIARGVQHAHQQGLIHRDLKPANILLDGEGRPHVADFGLARSQEAAATISGGMAGTPAYMAPEQARGEKVITTAVDVHALGAILFELLTGRLPYGTGEVMPLIRRIQEEPPPSIRDVRPDVPADLASICRKCLGKAPADRYRSAGELIDALTRYLNDEPQIGDHRPSVLRVVQRVIGWQRETQTMTSWRVAFWGAASTAFAMAVMQVAVLADAPPFLAHAAMAWYLIAWLGLMWVFLVSRLDVLNPAERASTAIHFGAKFGCIAILPVQLMLHDGNPVYALPSFLALVALATFSHGVFYWGRLYLSGVALFLATAAMTQVPGSWWPAWYGAWLTAFQFAMGVHLRRIHRNRP